MNVIFVHEKRALFSLVILIDKGPSDIKYNVIIKNIYFKRKEIDDS